MSEVNLEFKKHQIKPYMGETHPRAYWRDYKKPIARPLPAPPVAIQEVPAQSLPKPYISLASAIMSLTDGEPIKNFTVDAIKRAVSEITSITIAEITGQGRFRREVFARQVAILLTLDHTTHSFSRIGQLFGNRDHSTIIYSKIYERKHKARIADYKARAMALLNEWAGR